MPNIRVKVVRKVDKSIDTSRLNGYIASCEFSLRGMERIYTSVKFMCHNRGDHSKTGVGQYEIPLTSPLSAHFLKLIELCPEAKELQIERIRVQETGLNEFNNTVHTYKKLDDGYVRIVLHLREKEGFPVNVNINVSKKTSINIPWYRSMQTVLPEALSGITIESSSIVSGTHKKNAESIFIIMDAKATSNASYMIACRMAASRPITPAQIANAMDALQKQYDSQEIKEGLSSFTGVLGTGNV